MCGERGQGDHAGADQKRLLISVVQQWSDCQRPDDLAEAVAGGEDGDRVRHPEFGHGTVTDVEDDRVTVLFEDVGYRALSRGLVEERGLLEKA